MLYDLDIDYGRKNEIIIFEKLKIFFSNEKMKELDYYHEFDYTNGDETILCELKSRRCNFNEYNDTMLNISKLNKCKRLIRNKNKLKIEIYFFFYFKQNELYYWKYNEKDNLRYSTCNRPDRVSSTNNKYAYISRELLTKIE